MAEPTESKAASMGPALACIIVWGFVTQLGHVSLYLEGQGDVVNGLIMGIIWVPIWVIGVISQLTKSP